MDKKQNIVTEYPPGDGSSKSERVHSGCGYIGQRTPVLGADIIVSSYSPCTMYNCIFNNHKSTIVLKT